MTNPSPAVRLARTVMAAGLLAVPLFLVWVLVAERQGQSEAAQTSIAQGWGGPQLVAGPMLVIPYRTSAAQTATVNGQPVIQPERWEPVTIAPEAVTLSTELAPERRARAIHEAIVYAAAIEGRARFVLPPDLARAGIDPARLDLARAELRFGLSDPRGLGANPQVSVDGASLRLQPGRGAPATNGAGFFAAIDAAALAAHPLEARFAFTLRGNLSLALAPNAGDTSWTVRSPWPHPSFGGAFLPEARAVGEQGFEATYRVGNLALGRTLLSGGPVPAEASAPDGQVHAASIALIQPVDLYAQVDRATKYGFLFIGFTFLAFLMFDLVGGVRVGTVEYLLVGAGLILFFVMLLAFAEVTGFAAAYLIASAAITGLIAAYSAAILASWRRAAFLAGLLVALYAILYVLLSLESLSLLIGSLLLFSGLAAVMYLTRDLRWGATGGEGDTMPQTH